MAGIKKGLMLLVWRFQQVNSMIVIIGLSLTLTLQILPFVDWRFHKLGITSDYNWVIVLILFLIIFSGALIVGIIYDAVLKLWIQQQTVTIERQPYAKEKLAAKALLNRKYFWIPMLKKAGLEKEAEFSDKWVEHNMKTDANLRKDVNRVIQWINEYELKPADERWLKDIEEVLKKSYSPDSKSVLKK
ncbi:MAG: hypothetical protein ACFFG0_38700 [Candidatus Thorarchaeota archaeon]